MSDNSKYPKGLMVFSPNAKAPEFVKAEIVVNLNEFFQWAKENPDFQTEYKGSKQVKLTVKDGKKGLYAEVNTFKPKANESGLAF